MGQHHLRWRRSEAPGSGTGHLAEDCCQQRLDRPGLAGEHDGHLIADAAFEQTGNRVGPFRGAALSCLSDDEVAVIGDRDDGRSLRTAIAQLERLNAAVDEDCTGSERRADVHSKQPIGDTRHGSGS